MMKKSNGMRTVPQIFANNKHVGGFYELYILQQSGGLEKLLKD
jgi:glutaredoxin 3